MKKLSRYQLATYLAILFHAIGLVGIFLGYDLIISFTWANLLLMFLLVLYTQKINRAFLYFAGICFIAGMLAEWVGTQTGWLFGQYSYGKVLGPAVSGVPLVIGINWFLVMYCCGICIHTLLSRVVANMPEEEARPRPVVRAASIILDGALLAVGFDWLMEPVAVKLGYWQWAGDIPLSNYLSWFLVSILLLVVFQVSVFNKQNKFAVNLFLIQVMFFLVLRTFL